MEAAGIFGLQAELISQETGSLLSGHPCAAGVDQDLARVINSRGLTPMSQNPDLLKGMDGFVKAGKSLLPFFEEFCALLSQDTGTSVQRSQQGIRRRTGLKNIQFSFNAVGVDQFSIEMEQSGLSQARESLVRALDHEIRAAGDCSFREAGLTGLGKQMGTVGLIHQNRDIFFMADTADLLYFGQNALVGRTGQDHSSGRRVFGEHCADLIRADPTADLPIRIQSRYDPVHPVSGQLQRVEYGFMAVSGTEDFAPAAGQSPDPRQQAAGAPAYQIPGPVRPVQGGRPFHGLLQDPVRIMQVVRAGHLGHIPVIRQSGSRLHAPLMAGHVQGIQVL